MSSRNDAADEGCKEKNGEAHADALRRAREIVDYADDRDGKAIPACYSWVAVELSRALIAAQSAMPRSDTAKLLQDMKAEILRCLWGAPFDKARFKVFFDRIKDTEDK